MPFVADGVGVFDPSFALVDIGATISSDYKFHGAAAANGKIIFAPYLHWCTKCLDFHFCVPECNAGVRAEGRDVVRHVC